MGTIPAEEDRSPLIQAAFWSFQEFFFKILGSEVKAAVKKKEEDMRVGEEEFE